MGLGQSNSSESEDNLENDENIAVDEKSEEQHLRRQAVKSTQALDGDTFRKIARNPSRNNSGDTNGKLTHDQRTDKKTEEKNYSEEIIREKEKLLKEKEETIRQQADLIKTQNELLGHRKLMKMPKVQYDVIFKPRILKPLTETVAFPKSPTSYENVRSNGHENGSQVNGDKDYGKNYSSNRNYVVTSAVPTSQSNQIFKRSKSFTNPSNNYSKVGIPCQHDAECSTSVAVNQPTYYSSNPSLYDVPSTSNVAKVTPIMQARSSRNSEYRRKYLKKYEGNDDSTDQLLEDLVKQTNYELQKLNVQSSNGNSSHEVVELRRSLGDRKQAKYFYGFFKCSGCAVTWKSKISFVGATQKCKKCGCDVASRIMEKGCSSDDESRNKRKSITKMEKISHVD